MNWDLLTNMNKVTVAQSSNNKECVFMNKQWINLMGKMSTVSCLDHEQSKFTF